MRKLTLRNALLISAGFHLVWMLGLALGSLKSAPPAIETVTVELIPAQMDPPKVQVKKDRAESIPRSKQIVEQDAESLNREKPVKDAYLSAQDQRVERETTAAERGEFRNRRDSVSSTEGGRAGEKKTATTQRSDRPQLKDLLGDDHMALLKHQEGKSGEGNGVGDRQSEASRNNDYLRGIDISDETMLNTREFKYYTYYSRIRKQLAQYWEPKVRQKMTKMFRQGRRIASERDHITKLLITLNDRGQLVRVQVLGESGVQDLDDAATEAFRAAAPFPNPPQGIVESDGTVKIRWDFVLES